MAGNTISPGQTFNWLTTIEKVRNPNSKRKAWHWKCKCICGKYSVVVGNKLLNGSTKSCGCWIKYYLKNIIRKPFNLDLTGQKFGRLTVLNFSHKGPAAKTWWNCICDCTSVLTANSNSLRTGHTKSCGCYNQELRIQRATKHNLSHHILYSRWEKIKGRCTNKYDTSYHNYGGRGVRMCPRWINSPEVFIMDIIKKYPDWKWRIANKYEFDRYPNNNGDYELENIRLVPRSTNNKNKRTNRLIDINGMKLCITDFAKQCNRNPCTISYYIRQGLSPSQIWKRYHK